MIKLLSCFTASLLIFLSFSGCKGRENLDDSPPSSVAYDTANAENTSSNSESESTESSEVSQSSTGYGSEDEIIEKYIEPYRYLLDEKDWETPDALTPADYIMWYAVYVQNQHPDDELYMAKYMVDDKDGCYIPLEEFEAAAIEKFGVSSEHLRSDSTIYDAESNLYHTPMPLGPFAEKSVEVKSVVQEAENVVVHFTLTIAEHGVVTNKAMTVRQTGEGFQYLSYITE